LIGSDAAKISSQVSVSDPVRVTTTPAAAAGAMGVAVVLEACEPESFALAPQPAITAAIKTDPAIGPKAIPQKCFFMAFAVMG
jgi:hypothetical protein